VKNHEHSCYESKLLLCCYVRERRPAVQVQQDDSLVLCGEKFALQLCGENIALLVCEE
jgi:hypothetical protein